MYAPCGENLDNAQQFIINSINNNVADLQDSAFGYASPAYVGMFPKWDNLDEKSADQAISSKFWLPEKAPTVRHVDEHGAPTEYEWCGRWCQWYWAMCSINPIRKGPVLNSHSFRRVCRQLFPGQSIEGTPPGGSYTVAIYNGGCVNSAGESWHGSANLNVPLYGPCIGPAAEELLSGCTSTCTRHLLNVGDYYGPYQ